MKNCTCYEEIQSNLKAEGLSISDKCKTFRLSNLKMSMHIGFPLQTTDGKKPKRGKASFMFFSHCPWCGVAYETAKVKEAA